ncbi:MAG: phosphoglycerate dehydrogenase [Planctomycetota bacterium]
MTDPAPTPRILLTTTSYQDTPGPHHDALADSGFEVVRARGPLTEQQLLDILQDPTSGGGFDGLLNGDDHITAQVIDALLAAPRTLRVIAKYGIGLDSIDVDHATAKNIPVLFTPGVNHTTVAEHAFGLMIALSKHFWPHLREVKAGGWKRITGNELAGKTIAVLGMGRIGKEVVKRAVAFDMKPIGFDLYWDDAFAADHGLTRCDTAEAALAQADVASLHLPLTDDTHHLIRAETIAAMKPSALVINTARGGLVNESDIANACANGKLAGYGTDVLNTEPPAPDHPFNAIDNIVVTPHVGSRTRESVGRQAMRATTNLVQYLTGGSDFIRANG